MDKKADDWAILIQNIFVKKGLTLSLAESCTGGHLAATLTKLSGCSQYFLGSIVSYSNQLKIDLLGVSPTLLETEGSVSAQVVGQMAEGARLLTKSDYSLAVSGIAGPGGGSASKPVGTIWAAIARKGENTHIWNLNLTGTRQEIIEQCVILLLAQLEALLKIK